MQAIEALDGRGAIGLRIGPLRTDAIVDGVRNERAPELRDFVVVEADVVACDGASRETREDDMIGVAAELGANPWDDGFGVGDGLGGAVRGFVAPPLGDVSGSGFVEIGEAEPDVSTAGGETVAEFGIFDTAGAGIAVFVFVSSVAGEFDDDGVLAVGLPIDGEVEGVVDGLIRVLGMGLADSFAGGGGMGRGEGGNGEIGGDGADVGGVGWGEFAGRCEEGERGQGDEEAGGIHCVQHGENDGFRQCGFVARVRA